MIWESWGWKRDLDRRLRSLDRRRRQRRWPEEALVSVELDTFASAYSVRKLMECQKLSTEVQSIGLRAAAFKARGLAVDIMNWHKIDELYDLSTPTPQTVGLSDFCNEVVHSFVFVLEFGDQDGLGGFFVASDRMRRERVLFFEIGTVIQGLRRVVADDIVSGQWVRDAVGLPCRITKKTSRHESRP